MPQDPVVTQLSLTYRIYFSIPTRNSGQGQAAPGDAIVFFPQSPPKKGELPHIVLSGDGSQECYLLSPTAPFRYTVSTLVNVGGTVGTPAVGDVNGDGWAEVFVSAYDAGKIYAFTFDPSAHGKHGKPAKPRSEKIN